MQDEGRGGSGKRKSGPRVGGCGVFGQEAMRRE